LRGDFSFVEFSDNVNNEKAWERKKTAMMYTDLIEGKL
jgi:hypothetical protein